MRKRYKKASILDIFPIMIILFLVILVLIISLKVWTKIDDTDIFKDDEKANEAMQQTQNVLLAYDNLTIMIFIILSAITIVLASQVASHPAWFFISLLVLVIAFIVAAQISNVYEDISSNDELSSTASQFPKTTFLMGKLPLYVLVMVFSIAIAMYAGVKLL